MAKKIAGIIAGVSWAVFGLSFIFSSPLGGLSDTGVVMFSAGMTIGIFSLAALAFLALIDYDRRPR